MSYAKKMHEANLCDVLSKMRSHFCICKVNFFCNLVFSTKVEKTLAKEDSWKTQCQHLTWEYSPDTSSTRNINCSRMSYTRFYDNSLDVIAKSKQHRLEVQRYKSFFNHLQHRTLSYHLSSIMPYIMVYADGHKALTTGPTKLGDEEFFDDNIIRILEVERLPRGTLLCGSSRGTKLRSSRPPRVVLNQLEQQGYKVIGITSGDSGKSFGTNGFERRVIWTLHKEDVYSANNYALKPPS